MAKRDYWGNRITWWKFVKGNYYPHLAAVCLFFIGFIIYHSEEMSTKDFVVFLSIPVFSLLVIVFAGMIAHWREYTKHMTKD